jgi:hypothetical protein
LEAILFLLILGTLAFLAVPVYNSLKLYRQGKLEDRGESAPEMVPKVPEKNASTTSY